MGTGRALRAGVRARLRQAARRPAALSPALPPVWLLDLDNTLHDASAAVFPRINRAMTEFVVARLGVSEEQANELRQSYWKRYGATMLGLVRHHAIDAHDFLHATHPFPDIHRLVRRDQRLAHALRRLPGRKVVVTNAPARYARSVIKALGIKACLDDVISIEEMRFAGRFQPKPSRPMLRRLAARLRVPSWRCVLVEDSLENLRSAHRVGMRTVHVTGVTSGARRMAWKARSRSDRRVGLQVQSVTLLPRRKPRSAHRTR